jgi:hypothetical protein
MSNQRDLEEKLRSILVTVDKDHPVAVFLDKNALDDRAREDLSAEATGWPEGSVFVLVDGNPEELVRVAPLMTGKEWYARFEKEYDTLNGGIYKGDSSVMLAAKKAAGLE